MTSFHLLSAIGGNNAVTGPGANGEPAMFAAEVTEETALVNNSVRLAGRVRSLPGVRSPGARLPCRSNRQAAG